MLPLLIPIAISLFLTGLSAVLSYLLKPKMPKSNFASPTYSGDVMQNVTELGAPVSLLYGTQRIAPAIINYYKYGNEGKTRLRILASVGEGVIAGWQGIMINGQTIESFYTSRDDRTIYITHGEVKQKVYKFRSPISGTIVSQSGTSPDMQLFYNLNLAGSDTLQNATDDKPGYIIAWDTDLQADIKTKKLKDSYQVIRYLGIDKSQKMLTGCRVSKPLVNGKTAFQQLYRISLRTDGIPHEVIPGFGKVVVQRTAVNALLDGNWYNYSSTYELQEFSLDFSLPLGIYEFDKKDGYQKSSVQVEVQWKKLSAGWNDTMQEETVRDSTSLSNNYIFLKKNKSNVDMCDASGNILWYDTIEDADAANNWGDVKEGDWIDFSGKDQNNKTVTYSYFIEEVILRSQTISADPEPITQYSYRLHFSRNRSGSADDYQYNTYNGKIPTPNATSYTIKYLKTVSVVAAKGSMIITIPKNPEVHFSEYQATYNLPYDSQTDEHDLDLDFYNIRVRKITRSFSDPQDGVNETRIANICELTLDKLSYPGEALIGLDIVMNEKINGTVDNISALCYGKLVSDVQKDYASSIAWTGNSTMSVGLRRRPTVSNGFLYRCIQAGTTGGSEPTFPTFAGGRVQDGSVIWEEDSMRWSENHVDIEYDIATSEKYGRGEYLDLSTANLMAMHSALAPEAAYCDHNITENGITRKRLTLNIYIDFISPMIDILQALSKTFKAYNYWDGIKLLLYIDRSSSPVALFTNANILSESYKVEEIKQSNRINRFYAQFLDKTQHYVKDTCARDYIDENFSIKTLVPQDITLFGLTDKWRVDKTLAYLLRSANTIKKAYIFATSDEHLTVQLGQLFYHINDRYDAGYTGRIKAVVQSSQQIVIDKVISYTDNMPVIIQLNNGTVITNNVNGTGSGTTINLKSSIPAEGAGDTEIAKGRIYAIGTIRILRCVGKLSDGNITRILGLPYDETVFKGMYSNDPVSAENNGTTTSDETNKARILLDKWNKIPNNIIALAVKEHPFKIGTIILHITKPIDTSWTHCEIKARLNKGWKVLGTTRGEPIEVSGFDPALSYLIRATSYAGAVANPVTFDVDFDMAGADVTGDIPPVTAIHSINRGNANNILGRSFKIAWWTRSAMGGAFSSDNNLSVEKPNFDDGYKTLIEVYYPSLTDVFIGHTRADQVVVRSTTQDGNIYEYTIDDIIEDTKTLFSPGDKYYGLPIRSIKFVLYNLDVYNRRSESKAITLTNAPPSMYDASGSLITPRVTSLKSALRFDWGHSFADGNFNYDINNFILKVTENGNSDVFSKTQKFETNTHYAIGDIVHPPILNNNVYICTFAGTSGSSVPTFPKPGVDDTHPTFLSGTTLWQHLCGYRIYNIASLVNIDAGEDDAIAAQYSFVVDGLDPKKQYIALVECIDAWGRGTPSGVTTARAPNVSHDDDVSDILPPTQVQTPTFEVLGFGNLKGKWPANYETDIVRYIADWRAIQDISAVDPPSLTEVEQGYKNGSPSIHTRGALINTDTDDETAGNTWIVIHGAEVGFKYFLRVRAENSSRSEEHTS